MKLNAQGTARLVTCLAGALSALVIGCLPVCAPAAGLPASLQASNVESVIYGDDFFKPVAALKIDSVFTDHRRLGFFHIKLLPVLVAQGVRLEFAQTGPPTNWLAGLQFDPAPGVRRGAVEWRDFTVFFPQEKLPRLRANQVYPPISAAATVYRLEGVTIRSGGEQFAVPRAELRAEGQSGLVVWTRPNEVIQWDLFTGQFTTNTIKQGTQNEKP